MAQALAAAVLLVHLLFILWVIFGALLTRGRRAFTWIHVGCLFYAVIIEAGPWPCPLTLAENFFEQQAGMQPYRQPFLVYYLDAIVYPNVSEVLLVWCAAAVCAINLAIYGRRAWKARA